MSLGFLQWRVATQTVATGMVELKGTRKVA